AAICLGSVACAHAGIVVGDSLDWLVVSHDHVAIVKVVNPQEVAEGVYPQRTTFFQLEKPLKGSPPERSQFTNYVLTDNARLPMGVECLVFYKDAATIDYLINLSSPSSQGWRQVALSMDFDILKTRKAILDMVQARLKKLEHE